MERRAAHAEMVEWLDSVRLDRRRLKGLVGCL